MDCLVVDLFCRNANDISAALFVSYHERDANNVHLFLLEGLTLIIKRKKKEIKRERHYIDNVYQCYSCRYL